MAFLNMVLPISQHVLEKTLDGLEYLNIEGWGNASG